MEWKIIKWIRVAYAVMGALYRSVVVKTELNQKTRLYLPVDLYPYSWSLTVGSEQKEITNTSG